MAIDKKKALNDALGQTYQLLDNFNSIMHKDVIKNCKVPSFDSVVDKILVPSETLENKTPEETENKDDERFHLTLSQLEKACNNCVRCRLCETRKNVVFGEGCIDRPDVLVIGEGPGETEDLTGRPFVGKAGQYLDKWLASISLYRERNVYIANIVKCRPPENRDPMDDEKEACSAFVIQQIRLIKPKAILCLGKPSSSFMTNRPDASMAELRGRFTFYDGSIPMICTYHPAAVLRNLELKRPVWDDLKKLAQYLNLELGGK